MAQAVTMSTASLLLQDEELSLADRARTLLATRKLSLSPNILELLTMPSFLDELEEDCRPRISEDLKIGFMISDHATQTDTSEIGDLKDFTATTRTLLKFTNAIYDEFSMYKNVLKAQYEEKIQEQAFHLWSEIEDRLKYIEEFYKQKEANIRYSYQQQLCDALAILRTNYTKYFHIEEELEEGEVSLEEKIDAMRSKIEEQSTRIRMLEEELEDYQTKETKALTQHEEDIEKDMLLHQENWEFKQQIASLNQKLLYLHETVKHKEKEKADLDTEIRQMQDKRERDLKTIEKLMNSQEILKLELDREKQRVLAKALRVSVHVAKKVKKPGKGKLRERRASARSTPTKEGATKEAAAKKVSAEEAAAREAATASEVATKKSGSGAKDEVLGGLQFSDKEAEIKALREEIKKLRKALQDVRQRAQRLQQENLQSSRAWKLKFEILKKSLHAIKDEMFLRQSLRQATRFRRPSLTDRTALPLHIQNPSHIKDPFSSSLYMHYMPLPEINSQSGAESNEEDLDRTKIPVSISIPSAFTCESTDEDYCEEQPLMPSPGSSVP
ncbi:uncharacterized protein C10orf67 homolog, mitochondrial isoform X2 [Hemicordylus capensis]|uniref:uncharacterized protein C10orf67 homolog, mitochondrial isoform X2 n=1 Tax=Hemicordylus capensis TaxID=884348 RepID=UPI0023049A52|nr:uncharacterized protein C10orf67 homolog, mitochondrial isoform X2 [Hemicordylus capensis]